MKQPPSDHDLCTRPTTGERLERGWSLLRTRDFGLLWWGQAISQVGDGLNRVALLWFVYSLTGSALKTTAFVGLLQTVPPLVLGPLIGVYLDRLPKKSVMIWVDVVRTGLVAAIPLLHAYDALTLGRLYALVLLLSIVSSVFGPALYSAVPFVVARPRLTAANSLLQGTANLGILVGPAISGVGIALVGPQNVLYLNAVTYFLSVLCLLPIRVQEGGRAGSRPNGSGAVQAVAGVGRDLADGLRFMFVHHPTIFLLMVTSGLYHLAIYAFIFLLPVVGKEHLAVGPVLLGWIWSGLGAGMLVMSGVLAWIKQGDVGDRLRMVALAMTIGGFAVLCLSGMRAPLVAAALVILIGGSAAVYLPIVWAILQEITPAHLFGRVFTTFHMGGMASALLGISGFAWTADEFSPAASLFGIGLSFLAAAAVTAYVNRRQVPPSLAHPA